LLHQPFAELVRRDHVLGRQLANASPCTTLFVTTRARPKVVSRDPQCFAKVRDPYGPLEVTNSPRTYGELVSSTRESN
jgi:hypothetical protein